ncbi:toxin-antitoxin system YwqK family antitoxin [Rugamonas sp. DEMB1]|uniref:toxin-antitoxin system YwqK family antitoxin n=1 Tax=Rugamonas sp. DEMB1 TaxID=3039386 RepID=UPI00244B6385|nr:hypothetical protein [Rugamonas sp. DEMB1]WGG48126.1 hypothetical protein QC826_15380 [Rugamonas sp. DEMB1]
MLDLNIAEIPYLSGKLKCRYGRYLSDDGKKWIRHGLYREHHENGELASEGTYMNGVEHGEWRDYYPNGQLAAEGLYEQGIEVGRWRYWDQDGNEVIE